MCDGLWVWECGQSRVPDLGDLAALRLSAGLVHNCALDEEFRAHCWGLDTGGSTDAPGRKFFQITAGDTHSCGATATDSELRCWGDDSWNQRTVPAGVP